MEYVSIQQAAALLETNYTTVWRAINKGQYEIRKRPSEKQAGKIVTDIRAASLPAQAQARLMSQNQSPSTINSDAGSRGLTGLTVPNTSSDSAAWYQSLKPEHLAIIEKRVDIIERIREQVQASEEKNVTQIVTELAELYCITPSTYYRWIKAYDKHGFYGLRVRSFGSSRSKLNEDQKKYIKSLIRFNPDCRDTRIWEYVIDEFPTKPISGSTVSRYIRAWKIKNPDVFELLRNPDAWKNNFMLAFGSQSEKAKHFLHYVELDSTPGDLLLLDDKRYTIIGGIDIYSRKPKAYLSPTSSGMGVAALIRSIIMDWGVPENFVRDNGKDYICNQINLALDTLGINAVTLPPFTPEGKPHIERFFRTLSMSLFEETPGYIGHNVADRKAIESRRTFAQRLMKKGEDPIKVNLTPEDLQALMDRWIENVYNHRVHGGIKTTPENKAAQSTVPIRRIEDERALDILLLSAGTRVVGKKGIAFENGQYQSPQFAGWVGKEVLVRRDIDNAGLLYVFDLENNFICTAIDSAIANMTSAEYQAANKEQRRLVKEKVNAIDVLTENPMMRRINKSQAGKKIAGLSRTQTHTTPALEEAKNAALDRNGIKPAAYKTVAEQMNERTPYTPEIEEDEDPLAFMEGLKIVNQ